jgi:hypothetical protein
MDSLTRSLIKPFLPESIDGKEVTAVFGGGFKPPTSGHLLVIQKALQDHPEIDNVVIYVGSKVRDGITQDQSFKIWDEHYKTLIDRPVRIEKSVAPIKDIYRYAKDNPEDITYFILGARQGREDDLQDIVNRSKSISKYPNLQLKTIPTPDGGMSGTNARKALMLNDKEAFKFFVPSNIDYNEVWNILTSQPINEGDPKVGTGKKPKGSGRRLYTDENPNEAIDTNFDKVKFYHDYYTNVSPSTFEITLEENDIRISNIVEPYPSNFGPENVRQIPVNQNLEENIDPKSQSKHKGKSSPFGSAYEPVKEKKGFDKNLGKDPFGLNQFAREIMQEEELSYDTFDYPKHIKSLTTFMLDKGMKLRPLPTVKFINDDVRNAEDFFGKTAYYDPNNHRIVLYTLNRHPKDVMRSFAHEMIHHMQNHEGKLETIHTQNTNEEGDLPEIEREAYEKGNMTFRSWTDTITEGVLKEGRYDTLSNQISRDIFNFWKEDFNEGAEDSTYEDNYDFPPNGIQVKAQIIYKPGFKKLKVDGGSDIASKTLPGYLEVNFIVDPKMLPEFWEEISMNLKDVVRHEIEHITQLGTSRTKKEDFDEDFDTTIRALVKAKIIPQAEYFKLPREVDANLQGMYFRAKKERRPFADVINTYLDAQDITPKDKQIILNLWRSRRKALSLPKF